MKIIFPICSTSSKGEYRVTLEVTCSARPRIRVGDHFIGIGPVEDFNIIPDRSSSNWRDRFLVGSGAHREISIYGGFPEDQFYFDFPTIVVNVEQRGV